MKRPIKIHMLAHAWLLLLLCALSTPPAHADVTIWVTGPSSAPHVMGYDQTNVSSTNSLNNTQLTDYVYKNGRTWYYKTFQGSSISGYISLGMSADSWSSPDITVAQGDNYYYYDGSNTAYYLNPLLDITDKESYLLVVDEYNALDNWAKARITVDSEYMTMVGGTKASGNFATYAWSSSNTKSGTISFDRRSEDGSTSWNTGSETYTKGATYYMNNTGVWPNSSTNSLVSTYSSYVVPTTADIPTAMYLVGIVDNQRWIGNHGKKMTETAEGSGIFTTTAFIPAGATFGLATALSDDENMATQDANRYYPVSNGDYIVFESGLGTEISMKGYGATNKTGNFKMDKSDTYTITVNTNTNKVTFAHTNTVKYLMGGKGDSWDPTVGTPMRTTNGMIYQINCQMQKNQKILFSQAKANDNDGGGREWVFKNSFVTTTGADVEIDDTNIDQEFNIAWNDEKTSGGMFVIKTGTENVDSNYVVTLDLQTYTMRVRRMPQSVSKVTVHLEKTKNVSNPTLTAWNELESNAPLTPDDLGETTTYDKRTWYTWEIPASIASFNFTNNQSGAATSSNFNRVAGMLYYTWGADNQIINATRDYFDAASDGSPSCAVQLADGHYYVYFINTLGWPKVYAYAWNGETKLLGNYPGKEATLVGYDIDGNEVWLYDFGAITGTLPTEIIFNNGETDNNKKQQTGNLIYTNGSVYDMLGSVSLGRTLALALALEKADGRGTTSYTIDNELTAVYYDATSGLLYCKDDNDLASSSKSLNTQGYTDYMVDVSSIKLPSARYDQSNWIALRGNSLESLAGNKLTAGSVKGTISIDANGNAVMTVTDVIHTNGLATYQPNIYIPASFSGEYQYGHTHNYFFVQPKNMEYATITWAKLEPVVGDMLTFTMPEKGEHSDGGVVLNTAGLEGSFVADLSMIPSYSSSNFKDSEGEFFTFESIIKYPAAAESPAPRRGVKSNATAVGPTLMVYPTNLTPNSIIITSVNDVNAKRTVSRVTYVSPTGMRSAEPFEGVNIVITTYTDGTTSASKILK